MTRRAAARSLCCVMAKAPVAGTVKTRLCPPLEPEQAATLAAAFLLDTWGAAKKAFGDNVLLSHAGALDDFPIPLRDCTAVPQHGADLGARIDATVLSGLERADAVIVIGSDLPTLEHGALIRAIALLETADACLGPSADGGYYLIGARRWKEGLLSDLPWSAESTRAATQARLAEHGYAVAMAEPYDDIDEPQDLARLRFALATNPDAAPETARALALLGLA